MLALRTLFFLLLLQFSSYKAFSVGGSNCAGATTLTFSGCLAIDAAQTWNPTADGVAPSPATCAATGTKDSWYKFTATATTHYFLLYSDFDGAIYIYSGACGALSQINCADVVGTFSTESLSQSGITVGNTYYIQIVPYSGAGSGTYSIGVSDDAYCWTGWNGSSITAANNYANYNSAPGAATAVKIPSNAYTAFTISNNSGTYDIGALTVQTSATLTIQPASQSGALTIDIDNLTLESSAQLVVNQAHATYSLNLDVLDFVANASSSVSITNCNTNFSLIARDITIKSNANITFPNKGSTKEYTLTSRNITVETNGSLTLEDYVELSASGDMLINGTIRFDHVAGTSPIIGGSLSVNGNLNHQGHRYLYLTGASKNIDGTGNFYYGTSCPLSIRSGGSYTFGTLSSNTIRLSHLWIATGGTASLGSNTINTCFLLQSGTLNLNSGTLGIAGPTSFTMPNNGAKYANITWETDGFSSNPGFTEASFNEGTGTVFYNSGEFTNTDIFYTNNQTISSVTYYNLTTRTNNSYTATIGSGANFNVSNNFTVVNPGTAGGIATAAWEVNIGNNMYIGASATSNPSGNAFTLNCSKRIYRGTGTGVLTMGNNSAHQINITMLDAAGSGNECFTGFGTPTFYGTVNYSGGGNQEIIPASFYNLTLSGSGAKTALGNISINKNWTNDVTFGASTFKVSFTGSSNQNILGTAQTTFYKLEANNSSGDITVTKGPKVSNSIDFTLGDFIASTSTEPITMDVSATITTAASNTSHINGYIAKNTNTTTKFTFPCGNGTKYRPCAITPSAVAATTYRSKYSYTGYGDYTIKAGDPDLSTGNSNISTCEYWLIDRTSGATSATIELSWDTQSVVDENELSDLVVAHFDGADWESAGAANADAALNTISTNGNWNSFSPFTFASKLKKSALPVTLSSFSGNCTNNNIEIIWSTNSEMNNDFFTIEKSNDGITYSVFEIIPGHGNSNSLHNYKTIDYSNYETAYYRLLQTDFNGETNIFTPILISCSDINPNSSLSLNKISDKVIIRNTENEGIFNFKIFDSKGSVVQSEVIYLKQGTTEIIVPNNLSSGIYLMVLTGKQNTITNKIIF